MGKAQILEQLRAKQDQLSPVEMANFLTELTSEPLSQSALVFYFKQAFAEVPLRTVIESGEWTRVSGGGMSDDEFNSLLRPWIGPK